MIQLRPLTILVAGPVAVGIGTSVPFLCFDPSLAIAGALFATAFCLPLFGGLAWAVAPSRCPDDLHRVSERYRRFSRWVSVAGMGGGLYIVGCALLHLDKFLAPIGDWLLIVAFLVVMLMALSKVIMHERLRRFDDLAPQVVAQGHEAHQL